MTPPILVIGAHRSGTSVLNRVLGELGMFRGVRRDENDEALFFLRLNEWLLRQTGARWDHPEPVRDLLDHAEIRQLAADYVRLCLDSPRSVGFVGLRRYLRRGGVSALDVPWGFKDPRSSFTLPLWLDVFPDAKVIHIERHGVAVAASLRARQRRNLERSRRLFARNRVLLRFLPKRAGFTDSVRCATLDGAYAVWESYVKESRRHVTALGDRALELGYEELAIEPRLVVERVAAFCGLSPTADTRERAAGLLRRDRAGVHRDDPELAAFAARVSARERELAR